MLTVTVLRTRLMLPESTSRQDARCGDRGNSASDAASLAARVIPAPVVGGRSLAYLGAERLGIGDLIIPRWFHGSPETCVGIGVGRS